MYFNVVTGVAFVSLGCLFSGWMNLTLHSPVSCHCSKVLAKRWWKDRRRKIDLVGSMETVTEEPATISKQHKLTHPRVGVRLVHTETAGARQDPYQSYQSHIVLMSFWAQPTQRPKTRGFNSKHTCLRWPREAKIAGVAMDAWTENHDGCGNVTHPHKFMNPCLHRYPEFKPSPLALVMEWISNTEAKKASHPNMSILNVFAHMWYLHHQKHLYFWLVVAKSLPTCHHPLKRKGQA